MKKIALLASFLTLSIATACGQNLERATMRQAPLSKEISELIFKRQDLPPLFPGCSDERDKAEQRECVEEKLHQYFVANLQYPKTGEHREGTVIVQFIVEKDGSISEQKIMQDIGGGCGEEVMRVVLGMPQWSPGSNVGRSYRITYRMPVRFERD